MEKAKILGAEFLFKEKIEETREYVKKSEEIQAKKEELRSTKAKALGLFDLSLTKEILKKDPVLALASLRI